MGKRLPTTPRSKVRERSDKGIPKTILTGFRYGRLTVLGFSHMSEDHGSYWECLCDCGKQTIRRGQSMTSGRTRSCGCIREEMFEKWREGRHGERNPSWKGGKTHDKGYVKILTPLKDRFGKPKYILEHRKIVEEYLGRPLTKQESVHHKNAIKHDNRLENLEIMTKSPHQGSVVCPYCDKSFLIR